MGLSSRCAPSFACLLILTASTSAAWAWPPLLVLPDGADEVGRHFPSPPELESAVAFWEQLFLRYDSSQIVVHDRENMHIVWGVLAAPDGDPRVREYVASIRERLFHLQGGGPARDEEDLRLKSVVDGAGASAALSDAWQRVRAQRGVADHFTAGLERASAHLSDIRKILKEEGVPPELAALPFVETMFNPAARSAAGAVGLWQLMPSTARSLGLKVGRARDDRYEISKSTRAAARMLRDNYQMLGSWPLALTAYNHGPNGVRRAVASVGSMDLVYLIDHYERSTWGFASKNFYAEFLAALRTLSQRQSFAGPLVLTATKANPSMPSEDTAVP